MLDTGMLVLVICYILSNITNKVIKNHDKICDLAIQKLYVYKKYTYNKYVLYNFKCDFNRL